MDRIPSTEINTSNFDLQKVPKPYLKIARGMEKQFAQFMIEQMEKTVDKTSTDSSALKYYKSLLNDKHATIMTEKGDGLGLQNMILDQILPDQIKYRYLKNQSKNPIEQYSQNQKVGIGAPNE